MSDDIHLPVADVTLEGEGEVRNQLNRLMCCHYCGSYNFCYITEYVQRINTFHNHLNDRFMTKQRMVCENCHKKAVAIVEYNLRKNCEAYRTAIRRAKYIEDNERLEAAFPYENPPKRSPDDPTNPN